MENNQELEKELEEAVEETVETEAEEVVEETAEAETEENTEESAETEETEDAEKKGFFGKKKDKKDKKDLKIEELEDKVKRQLAEFENFRNRTEKEKSRMYEFGARDVIEKMLPVVDNFERGLAAIPEEVRLLITIILASAPASFITFAESNSQFVPGNTGITTLGVATLIAADLCSLTLYSKFLISFSS